MTGCRSGAPGDGPLLYQYVSDAGAAVSCKDEARVSVEAGRVGFLVRCRPDALAASGRAHWPDLDR